MKLSEKFAKVAESKAFDTKHRQTINFNMNKYDIAVEAGLKQYQNHELARSRASYIKTQTIAHLDEFLLEFEDKFTKNGGKIIWADTTKTAIEAIDAIFKLNEVKSIVKSKSMTTEEIHFNDWAKEQGLENVETDLGEYICQLAGQKPYHIVTPAMHMSKKDIAELFVEKLHIPLTDDAQELTLTARRLLREKYTTADIGITGGNFMVADIGAVAITENEGNARLCATFPKIHISIIGIEKVIPTLSQLDLFWSLLSTSGTGQKITVYNTLYTGARHENETDGPEEMYLILLDNGRTNLLAKPEKRQALNCIRCGACLNACPVYKNIGGHTYDTTYSGPIGSVITPHLSGMKDYKHLSFASSLCGACTSVCPVKIDIHNLLLMNRRESVEEGYDDSLERIGFKFWKNGMKSRRMMDLVGSGLKNKLLIQLFKNSWGKKRDNLQTSKKSFNELWKERNK